MAITTILDYAGQRKVNAETDATTAQQQLATAQSAVTLQTKALADATSALTDLEQQSEQIRLKLAVAPTSADADALSDELEEITIRVRTAQAKIVDTQASLLTAQGEAARAQTDLANAGTRLTVATADLSKADAAAQQRAARALVLAAPPLSTLAADAADALDETTLPEGEIYRAAKARLTVTTADRPRDIPDKLFKRAKNRRENALLPAAQAESNVQAATDAVLKERNDNGGAAGVAQKLWGLFQQADANAQEFVTAAKTRFDTAQTNLVRVADLENAPLTAEQSDRINDSSLAAARATAADTEKARDDKGKAILTAQAALDAEILKALAAGKVPDSVAAVVNKRTALTGAQSEFAALDDPWRMDEKNRDAKAAIVATREKELQQKIDAAVAAQEDPETNPAVIQARIDLNTAEVDLSVAENNYKQTPHFVLHAWEAAVPDSMWRLFEDSATAEDILNDLKTTTAATLQSDLVAAESAYVMAQLAADASESKLINLLAEQARREARLKTEQPLAPIRTFGALRGDN